MSLSHSSTYQQVVAAYEDNCDYDASASVAKARLFIQACRFLLRRLPRASGSGASRVDLDPGLIERQLSEAVAWATANDATSSAAGGVRHLSLENFRC